MLMRCDFIYAGASTKFQMPFTTLLSFGGFAFSRWDEVAETWK
jgi:enoyl-CoA hydratase/carnithine racemase